MPSYAYYCQTCHKTFELRMTIQEHDTRQIQCPHCQSDKVEQMVAAFFAVTSKKS